LDLAALAGAPPEVAEEAPAGPAIRKVAAKAGVKMCSICMASVPEAELLDIEGQKMCAACAEKMKGKALRKGAEKK
jgi:formylmethanofuran dehydrogenase subunit E